MNFEEFKKYVEEQIGMKVKLDSMDGGIHQGKKYFNIDIEERLGFSQKYNALERLSKTYGKFTVEPNGLTRLVVFAS